MDPAFAGGNNNKGTHLITGTSFRGFRHTDKDWLTDYLGIPPLPFHVPATRLEKWRKMLLTTRVFLRAEIRAVPDPENKGARILEFIVEEKWTTIPVVRGQAGGGTPLMVVGAYETHFQGRLLTTGAEMHKYGDAPPGGVAYFRAPKWNRNRGDLAVDIWKDVRWREIWDGPGHKTGRVELSGVKARGRWLTTAPDGLPFPGQNLQLGPEIVAYRYSEGKTVVSQDDPVNSLKQQELIGDWNMSAHPVLAGRIHLMLKYDTIEADNVLYDGLRLLVKNGPGREQEGLFWSSEWELFWYHMASQNLNLAFHGFIGSQGSESVFSRYFLGGFDSIRGIPDGALNGPKAAYLNAEARYLFRTWPSVWLQTVAFLDAGTVQSSLRKTARESAGSLGLGIRFIVPAIYRFIIRLDFAWDVKNPRTSGLSAGFNHLFQPYRPL